MLVAYGKIHNPFTELPITNMLVTFIHLFFGELLVYDNVHGYLHKLCVIQLLVVVCDHLYMQVMAR